MNKVNIGIIGCGKISDIYLKNLTTKFFDKVKVHAVADIVENNAKAQAKKYNIENVMDVNTLISCPEIDIVLVLTTPQSHYELCKKSLLAGKNTYTEKPLSLVSAQGKELCELAEQNKILLGAAPDTFLGAGIQTCKQIINNNTIGKPVAATAFMMCHGWENSHPNPEFYYLGGGGPMFDMGPYYITALVSLLGKCDLVSAMTSQTFNERVIGCGPRKGERIRVEVPTHITGTMRFKNGSIATIITSFDVWDTQLPAIQIYGTEGTLIVPDPNTFDGPVLFRDKNKTKEKLRNIPLISEKTDNSRGLGIIEMAEAIQNNKKEFSTNANLAYHVLEIMEAFHISGEKQSYVKL